MVFDDRGQQMADYQGHIADHGPLILRDATEATEFHMGVWRQSIDPSGPAAFRRAVVAALDARKRGEPDWPEDV